MNYSTDPAKDWDTWIEQQESTHDTLHPVDRILYALGDERGFFEAEIGEYGHEWELLADLMHAAIEREVDGKGSDWDIARRAKALAAEVIKNRGWDYWERVDENRQRAISARSEV